jgi:demethylspheroidene O-methyltransferase
MDSSRRDWLREQRRMLFDRIYAFYEVKVLATALETGVFRALSGPGRTLHDLASETALPVRGVRALVIALRAMELVTHAGGRYQLSDTGTEFFVEHKPGYMGDVVKFADWQFDALPRIGQAICHGEVIWNGFEHYLHNLADGDPTRGDAAREHQRRQVFNAALASSATATAKAILKAVDLSTSQRLLDIGGNLGVFTSIVLAAHPDLQSTILDLPDVAAIAQAELERRGLAARARALGCDFCNDPWPAGHDLISFVRILATRDRDAILHLLRKAHAALAPGGRVLFYEEHVLGPEHSDVPRGAAWATLFILMGSRGEVRHVSEWEALFQEAGFAHVEQILGNPWGIVVARKS